MGALTQILRYGHAVLPCAVLALAVYLILYPPRRRRLERLGLVSDARRELGLLLFGAYCSAMALLTLTPLNFDLIDAVRHGYEGPFFRPGEISWQVMRTYRFDKLVFWGNVVMFMPFGFCPALLWRRSRWYKALAIGAAVTLTIECWQLRIGRTFDVDDLLLNTLGAMLGWLIWRICKKPTLICEER